MASPADRRRLIALLDEMFHGPAWHGPSLRNAVRGVDARAATRRPAPARHNVAEIAVHAAYWKFVVRKRITADESLTFPIAGSNFFPRRSLTPAAWRADIALLEDQHRQLVAAVRALPLARLDARIGRNPAWTIRETIQGAAAHDAYHAGQIRLVRRLIS